jgi:hypothetical protein
MEGMPRPRFRAVRFRSMLNELLPKLLKLSLSANKAQSNAVKMPTNAMMPTAIIVIVKPERNLLPRTDCQDIFMISLNFIAHFFSNEFVCKLLIFLTNAAPFIDKMVEKTDEKHTPQYKTPF